MGPRRDFLLTGILHVSVTETCSFFLSVSSPFFFMFNFLFHHMSFAGTPPLDRSIYPKFPDDLFLLPAIYCDPSFLHRDEVVVRSSLAASLERLFVHSGNMIFCSESPLWAIPLLRLVFKLFLSSSPISSIRIGKYSGSFLGECELGQNAPPLPNMKRPGNSHAGDPTIFCPHCQALEF